MAFPATALLDNFNRANGALAGNWTGNLWPSEGVPSISSNQVVGTTGGWRSAYFNPQTFTAEAEVFATIANAAAQVDLYMLVSNPGGASITGYALFFVPADPGLRIARVDSSSSISYLKFITVTIASGDAIGLGRTPAGVFQAYRKPSGGSWATIDTTVTDTTYTAAGFVGLELAPNNSVAIDNFGGGNPRPLRGLMVGQAVQRAAVI